KALSDLPPDDLVAVVEASTHATVLSGFAPPVKVQQMLRDLGPGYGTSSLSEGLREAVHLLAGRPRSSKSTVYVVSDFQKAGCRSLASCPVPQDIEVTPLPVGDLFLPNVAILGLDASSHDGERPHVSLASFSDEDKVPATLSVRFDDQQVSSAAFELKPGTLTNVDLQIPRLKPGWHHLQASLRVKDGFDADNSRFASLWVPEPSKILVAEPKTDGRVFERETFFLSAALDPTEGTTNSAPGPFNLKQVATDRIPAELSGATPDRAWNVVVLPALKDLPVGLGQSLSVFVRAGGGLVLFMGEGMSANRYNNELGELLPARIGSPEPTPDVGSPWRVALYDTNSLIFAPFRIANSGDLRIPEFTGRFTLEPLAGSTRLCFFQDGTPLVMTKQVGKGKVVLVNTSANTMWNDWPKHKTFVPFVHGLAKYCAQHADEAMSLETTDFVAGEEVELDTGKQNRSAEFTVRTPDHKEIHLKADQEGRLRDPKLAAPGVYSVVDKSGRENRRIAINLPEQESNLEAVRPVDFVQQLTRVQDSPKQTLAAGLFGAQTDQREFWQALLLAALILLLAEPFIANRTTV
ncbi:MAG TPA: hypothetical protein VLT36_04205, partial [Candidatus Dormibacteraeota bacterium]|nr:hypothetical protein [Candidatus Dormibacteraeota bacterium]